MKIAARTVERTFRFIVRSLPETVLEWCACDKPAVLEAMKMQTTIYAPADRVIAEVLATAGDSVEADDLLVKLRA